MSNYEGVFTSNQENSPWNIAFDLVAYGSKVLDIGCSNGAFGEALIKQKNCQVDGVEPDAGDAKKAAKVLSRVSQGFVEDIFDKDLIGRKYDYVIFLDVIEHMIDPVRTLKLVTKILSKNGQVIFSIPNMAHVSVRLMLLAGKFYYGKTGLLDNTHLHFYTKESIEKVFLDAGYHFTQMKCVYVPFSPQVIDQELRDIGAGSASNDIKNLLMAKEASVFQYVGSAAPGRNTSLQKIDLEKDVTNPQGFLVDYYEKREKVYTDDIKFLNQEHERLSALVETLSKRGNIKNAVKRVIRVAKDKLK